MSTEDMPGPLSRLFNFALKVAFVLVGYAISIVVLMSLEGPVVAAAGDGAFNIIFGAWVLGTLALLGWLT